MKVNLHIHPLFWYLVPATGSQKDFGFDDSSPKVSKHRFYNFLCFTVEVIVSEAVA